MTRQARFWLGLALGLGLFLYLIHAILAPFVLAALAAYLLDPLVRRLQRLCLGRTGATVLVTVLFFALIALLLITLAPLVAAQCSSLIASLPESIDALDARYGDDVRRLLFSLPDAQVEAMKQSLMNATGELLSIAGNLAAGLLGSGAALINLLSLVLITPVVTFYLLRDWDRLLARAGELLPRAHAATIREQLSRIDATLAGFLRGQLNVCLLLGTFYATWLSLAGLNFAVAIGLGTGLLTIFPYIGLTLGMATGLAVALLQFDTTAPIVAVLAVFVVGQMLEGYWLTPKLVGEKVGLHPVWVVFGMLAGGALMGFVGVLVAVPASAVVGVLARFAVARYEQSGYYRSS